jgi:hypothetical protein
MTKLGFFARLFKPVFLQMFLVLLDVAEARAKGQDSPGVSPDVKDQLLTEVFTAIREEVKKALD